MLKTNKDKLVKQSVCGRIHHPTMHGSGYYVGFDGKGRVMHGVGGITYNYFIKDNCMNLVGDHVEPGVSCKNRDTNENNAFNALSCIGNIAKVISGDAKGALGFVSGKHGGVDHVMIAFREDDLYKLNVEDNILVYACGQGLELSDHPEIKIMNLDPQLLERMNICTNPNHVEVKVTHIIPAHLMGSGLGSSSMLQGDYDIMTHDKHLVQELGLDNLRFGDIIAIRDHYCANGADYLQDAISIGVIVHSDSYTSGHGPGVCVIMTAKDNAIKPIVDSDANIANYLDFKR